MSIGEVPRTVLTPVANAALVAAGAALLSLAVVEGWQVFARYVLNDSPSWTEPVALLLMNTAMMMGAAIGVRAEAHFGFFIAVEASPPKLGVALRLIARLIAAAIGVWLAVSGAILIADGWTYSMAGVPLPQGIVYLPMSVGGALIALFAIERMVRRAEQVT